MPGRGYWVKMSENIFHILKRDENDRIFLSRPRTKMSENDLALEQKCPSMKPRQNQNVSISVKMSAFARYIDNINLASWEFSYVF